MTIQLALFNDTPEKKPRKKRVKSEQLVLFGGGYLFEGKVTKLQHPIPSGKPGTVERLTLSHPDETEQDAREREAREAHINRMFESEV